MKNLFGIALVGLAAATGPARAEFQITSPSDGVTRGMRAVARPIVLSPPPAGLLRRPTAVPIANGFGRQVPLAFATRQIVPKGVKTTYGPEVDQAALVDWMGGGPWIGVLRTAVQRLGLHVSVHWMVVSITAE